MILDRLDEIGLVELGLMTSSAAFGRHAEVVQPAHVVAAAELGLALRDRRPPAPPAPADVRDVAQPLREVPPAVVGDHAACRTRSQAARAIASNSSVSISSSDVPMIAAARAEPGLEEPQQPGQELAAGEVTGGAEEHDDVGLVHEHDGSTAT